MFRFVVIMGHIIQAETRANILLAPVEKAVFLNYALITTERGS